jgi:hypothetical protein
MRRAGLSRLGLVCSSLEPNRLSMTRWSEHGATGSLRRACLKRSRAGADDHPMRTATTRAFALARVATMTSVASLCVAAAWSAAQPATAVGATSHTHFGSRSTAPIVLSGAELPQGPYPGNGTDAITKVNVAHRELTVDTWSQDIQYQLCHKFDALSSTGKNIGFSHLGRGDFVTLSINPNSGCVSSVQAVSPPAFPQCSSSGFGGDGTVVLLGANMAAHSVVYKGTDSTFVQVVRWCNPPTVVGANQEATVLPRIGPGTIVTLDFSYFGWVTSVSVGEP